VWPSSLPLLDRTAARLQQLDDGADDAGRGWLAAGLRPSQGQGGGEEEQGCAHSEPRCRSSLDGQAGAGEWIMVDLPTQWTCPLDETWRDRYA
jgi:hypothetical protein